MKATGSVGARARHEGQGDCAVHAVDYRALRLIGNVMCVVWGYHSGAPALITLQECLMAMNIRGAIKSRAEAKKTGQEARRSSGAGSGARAQP